MLLGCCVPLLELEEQEEERELLAQKKAEEAAAVAAINAQHQQQAGDHLLDQLKDEMRGASLGSRAHSNCVFFFFFVFSFFFVVVGFRCVAESFPLGFSRALSG